MTISYDYKRILNVLESEHFTLLENISLLTILNQHLKKNGGLNRLTDIKLTNEKGIDKKLIDNLVASQLIKDCSTPEQTSQKKYSNLEIMSTLTEACHVALIGKQRNEKEIKDLLDLITKTQATKVDTLLMHISKTYEIPIKSSKNNLVFINHLSSEYSLYDLLPLFHWEARKTKKIIKGERLKAYEKQELFLRNVEIRINKTKKLANKNLWKLPNLIKTPPLESLFCHLYLENLKNWDHLSPREIVSIFLKTENPNSLEL